MVAPLIIAGVTAAAQLGAAYMAQSQAAKTEKERRRLLEQAREEFSKLPDPNQSPEIYQQIDPQGELRGMMEITQQAPETAMAGISVDPRLQEAQYGALAKLAQLGEGGVTQAEQLDIERARRGLLADQAAQQAAIQESMARRGVASGGMEAVMRQQAAQEAANKTLDYESQVQADARRRALESILSRGSMAGQMRSQQFGEEESKARARDEIARFNAQLAAETQARNIAAQRQVQGYNLAEKQRIYEQNAAGQLAQTQAANRLAQQQFQNQLARTQGMTGQTGAISNVLGEQAAGTRQMWGGIGQGATQIGSAYIGAQGRESQQPATTQKPAVMPEFQDWEYGPEKP